MIKFIVIYFHIWFFILNIHHSYAHRKRNLVSPIKAQCLQRIKRGQDGLRILTLNKNDYLNVIYLGHGGFGCTFTITYQGKKRLLKIAHTSKNKGVHSIPSQVKQLNQLRQLGLAPKDMIMDKII